MRARDGASVARGRRYGTGNCEYLDGVVANCTFSYGGRGLRLQHIIEKYGDPEFIIPIAGYADARWLQVVLMYPECGFETGYLVPTWTSAEITLSPNTKIHGYSIFAPDLYGQLLDASLWFSATREEVQEWQHPWPGYGTFVVDVPQYTDLVCTIASFPGVIYLCGSVSCAQSRNAIGNLTGKSDVRTHTTRRQGQATCARTR